MEVETEKRLAKNTTKRKGDSRGDTLIAIGVSFLSEPVFC